MGLMVAEIVNELSSHCHEQCSKKCTRHLGISTRQAEAYIAEAQRRLRAASSSLKEVERRDQYEAMLHRCFQGAFARGDYKAAANITMQLATLNGVLQPPAPQAFLNLLNVMPDDKERFPGDANYRVLTAARDYLMARAAAGDPRAAEGAARIASGIVDNYGASRGSMKSEDERALVEKVRANLVTQTYFPPGMVFEPITTPINDFAGLETPGKEKEPKE